MVFLGSAVPVPKDVRSLVAVVVIRGTVALPVLDAAAVPVVEYLMVDGPLPPATENWPE